MAAPRAFLRLTVPVCNGGTRGIHDLSGRVPPEGSKRKRRTLLQFLSDHFYDVEFLREYLMKMRMLEVHQKNRPLTNIQEKYGPYIRGAFFILNQGGAVKFQGHEWIRSNKHGRFSSEFLKLMEVPVQAVDASGCAINYKGLDNLLPLRELQSLSLQRCPYVDDWFLSGLHPLARSLEELSLAGCPRVSERGLACLHHLQNLRRLDISDLPAVAYPGLTRILVEEMLPNCEVLGSDGAQELKLGLEGRCGDTVSPIST